MNHAQLRAFHAVASEGSFTRAAAALHVTQPTLSGQVKALEESFGVRLFDRRGRKVMPTELGRELRTDAAGAAGHDGVRLVVALRHDVREMVFDSDRDLDPSLPRSTSATLHNK